MRILIADDDRISQRLLAKQLDKLGHEVVAVSDGTEALERINEAPPDIAIIDWMMPGLDGPEICRYVRGRSDERYIYVILLTTRDARCDVVAGLDSGADDYLTKPVNLPELEARLRSGQRIIQLQEGLISARERMRALATRDALTGLLNRGAVFDIVRRELRGAQRERQSFAVLICDVDHFKRLNDTYGHPAGDAALREIAARMSGSLRASDWVGRYGGEEFLIALPRTSAPQAFEVAERMRRAVCDTPVTLPTAALQVSVSIGAAVSDPDGPEPSEELEALVERADVNLLLAKRQGRNQVVLNGPAAASAPAPAPAPA